jgi:hypothetical protein
MCFSLKLQKRGNRYICPKETGRTFRPQMPITATPESLTADALKHSLITLKDHGQRTSLVVHNQEMYMVFRSGKVMMFLTEHNLTPRPFLWKCLVLDGEWTQLLHPQLGKQHVFRVVDIIGNGFGCSTKELPFSFRNSLLQKLAPSLSWNNLNLMVKCAIPLSQIKQTYLCNFIQRVDHMGGSSGLHFQDPTTKVIIPIDGLIFSDSRAKYCCGSDPSVQKVKEKNTIDLVLMGFCPRTRTVELGCIFPCPGEQKFHQFHSCPPLMIFLWWIQT